ncbi:MAG TPA: ATP-binding protein [Candidatus Hydrogenedentes bacterium]|nr:ATP-binding protein [Candidatus Hydrogenedentota bacterium]HOS02108.1 ATP-binding protein [Candidatus Hydrogenedentota bacterium]
MLSRRNGITYGLLALAGALICAWQGYEHLRATEMARSALLHRALDISNTLGVVLRSQGIFGMVRQSRLEAALRELIQSGELTSVALLYASGEVAASAGPLPQMETASLVKKGFHWSSAELIVVNPVDLGGDSEAGDTPQTSIVIPEGEAMDRYRPPRPRDDRDRDDRQREHRRAPASSPQFGRPFWMSEQQYRDLVSKQGVHYFVLTLSTGSYRALLQRDLHTRIFLAGIALVAVAGLGLAWRNAERSSALQMDLLRADEMNRHLREMNLAAAGLAHETRNPLNVIRGFAQVFSRRDDVPGDVRETSWRIADEVDRVTDRLNQFIAYSRPPEAKPVPVDLKAVVRDVARTLESDREDKQIVLELSGPTLTVEADESLLRQIVFNLMLNAIQALPHGGSLWVQLAYALDGMASLEVRDNGPGVPEVAREDIFRPYFTTSEQGTGLGLAVVRQAVLAHRWSIVYAPADDGGAIFRVSGLRVV